MKDSSALIIVACSLIATPVWAADPAPPAQQSPTPPAAQQAKAPDTEKPSKLASPPNDDRARNFYQVLEDVLGDFEYDLKTNQVKGLTDVSIRNVAMSENVPTSFRTHLELLVTERILRTVKTQVLQCLPCRSKKASLSGDDMVISSPETNPAELARIAKIAGIQNFLDIAFSYQPQGMIASLTITDANTGSVNWSRSYNSETSRSSAFRRGVDFSQTDDARLYTEYRPTIAIRPTLYYLLNRDISGYKGCIGIGLRVVERYDNRSKEVGFEANYNLDTTMLTGAPATEASIYRGFNGTLLFVHAWNFNGDEENFNKLRGSLYGAIGGTYAAGFLGALARIGWEWRLGKHWGLNLNVGYRPASTVFLPTGVSSGIVSGVEFGLGVAAMF